LDTYECIKTKLDIHDFSSRMVPPDLRLKILEAGRLTGSERNSQHWRFILVRERRSLERLMDDSISGKWIKAANFAIIVLTDPRYVFNALDTGRAIQDMQLAAWNYGVASGIFTGIRAEELRKDFNIPTELNPTAVVGFGYPDRKIIGKKSRKPLEDIAFLDKYGNNLKPKKPS